MSSTFPLLHEQPATLTKRPSASEEAARFAGGSSGDTDATIEVGPRCAGGDIPQRETAQSPLLASRFDELRVFQAAPLAWRDTDGILHQIERLDFEREREILSESTRDAALVGAEINVVFDTATTDRLGAFLATSSTQVLHFSCHGSPQYLCFEDGNGGAQFLMCDDLREVMSVGRGVQFVFVSACYSRAVGEAFVNAGVPHVLCCQQDERVMDVATIEFARNFYRAIACGRDLLESFELGKQAVKLSPLVPDSENEMKKFLLLPEDGTNHSVPVFYAQPRQQNNWQRLKTPPGPAWILPHPPHKFMGRELEMYKLLQALQRSRLVKVTGPDGIGKRSLAAAVCQYINARNRTFSIEEIIWLPLIHSTRADGLSTSFHLLFNVLQKKSGLDLHLDSDYNRACGTIVESLYQKKALVVIETNVFVKKLASQNFSFFLVDLFRGTRDVKIVLVTQEGFDISLHNSCVESEVELGPLGFAVTATLFGSMCPYTSERRYAKASTPRQLCQLLVPDGQHDSKIDDSSLSKRSIDILSMIGEGVPSKIHEAATGMKPQEYDLLIETGERKEYVAEYKSRAELEDELARLEKELETAIKTRNFVRAKEIQEACGELERSRESLPGLLQLRARVNTLDTSLSQAVSMKDFGLAKSLHEELVLLRRKIEQEEKASSKVSGSSSSNTVGGFLDAKLEIPHFSTRAELEADLKKLEQELDAAAQSNDFKKARDIQWLIIEVKKHRESLPSSSELSLKIHTLNKEMESATKAQDFVRAESIHKRVEALEQKLALEKDGDTIHRKPTKTRRSSKLFSRVTASIIPFKGSRQTSIVQVRKGNGYDSGGNKLLMG